MVRLEQAALVVQHHRVDGPAESPGDQAALDLVRRGDAAFATARDAGLPDLDEAELAATLRVLGALSNGLDEVARAPRALGQGDLGAVLPSG
jgi:hypothetical protein